MKPNHDFTFITGAAGCGKTFWVRNKLDRTLLTATSGIAAVNLGASTVNHALGYFDLNSLRLKNERGRIRHRLGEIAQSYRVLCIDEISTMPAEALDIIVKALMSLNERMRASHAIYARQGNILRLVVVGDFCQLPPIEDEDHRVNYAFQSKLWGGFKILRLRKNWRQDHPTFLRALDHLRMGDGESAARLIDDRCFHDNLDEFFDGTTIVATNRRMIAINQRRLQKLRANLISYSRKTWGQSDGTWAQIPDELELKIGTRVMILANLTNANAANSSGELEYSNGDCGILVGANDEVTVVQLDRNDKRVCVKRVHRPTISYSYDGECEESTIPVFGKVTYNPDENCWYVGGVDYMPLRLAYATTVHKSQGLTLDNVQVDLGHSFMGAPSMCYVAISRCRTMQGLRIVGDRESLARRTRINEEVRKWL
jgi:ATP-dependent DNA helicase PIF1